MRLRALLFPLLLLGTFLAADADARPKRTAKKKRDSKQPPIAFYLADYGTSKADTRDRAIEKCRASRAKQLQKHPELAGYTTATCESSIVTVRGPYARKPMKGEPYDDEVKTYVFKGSDGQWYDANGESPCFVAGTRVATPDGEKTIETLQEGDVVWSWDLDNARLVHGVVERTKRRVVPQVDTLVLAGGVTVTATPNHPFFSARAHTWVELGKLQGDDAVMIKDGDALAVRALDGAPTASPLASDAAYTVYDLTVSPQRNYFAAGVLVHNY